MGNQLHSYKFEKYVPGQEVRFVANENYYAGKPKLKLYLQNHIR